MLFSVEADLKKRRSARALAGKRAPKIQTIGDVAAEVVERLRRQLERDGAAITIDKETER